MKYLKTFENLNTGNPQVGDYVICSENVVNERGSKEFIKSNIGRYIKYLHGGKDVVDGYRYVIEYENVPFELRRGSYDFDWETGSNHLCIRASREDILMWSSDKDEIERENPYIQANKYNL